MVAYTFDGGSTATAGEIAHSDEPVDGTPEPIEISQFESDGSSVDPGGAAFIGNASAVAVVVDVDPNDLAPEIFLRQP